MPWIADAQASSRGPRCARGIWKFDRSALDPAGTRKDDRQGAARRRTRHVDPESEDAPPKSVRKRPVRAPKMVHGRDMASALRDELPLQIPRARELTRPVRCQKLEGVR